MNSKQTILCNLNDNILPLNYGNVNTSSHGEQCRVGSLKLEAGVAAGFLVPSQASLVERAWRARQTLSF